MDLRISEVSFKGSGIRTIGKILAGTALCWGLMTACQRGALQKDTFNRNADYITLNEASNKQADTAQIMSTLNASGFFPQQDRKIVSSIMANMGIETIGCITTNDNLTVYGECNSELYKFYVRRSDDNVFYGLVDKLVPGKAPDFKDDPENTNKTFAFILKNVPGNKSGLSKQVTYAELIMPDERYCNDFMFGDGIYDKSSDIKIFTSKLLNKESKSIIYTLEQ